jgi:DNA (cytosine-5)-methyltransferase 1
MNLSTLNKSELIKKCKELGIKKYSKKTKIEIIVLIQNQGIDIYLPMQNTIISDTNPILEPTINTNNIDLKFVDLFCGIGGFHQALRRIGGECVFACDIDTECRKTYKENYGLEPSGDITEIDIQKIPPFDILCAGFPCQPFSKAGFQKGFDDDRGNLFFHICKIVETHRPKYMILENVKNLSSHDDGNTWRIISAAIDTLGYYTYTEPVILNVLHFNIPQNRERVIIMCKRKDLGELPTLPNIPSNPKIALTSFIKDYILEDTDKDKDNNKDKQKNKINGKLKAVETIWDNFLKILIQNRIEIPKYPIWTDWWDNEFEVTDPFYLKYTSWIDKNRDFYSRNRIILEPWLLISRENPLWLGAVRKFEWQAGDLLETDGMNTVLWSARGSGIRVKRPNYIPTLVAMSMVPVYGPESRKLTARELLRLQSFPDEFRFNEKTIYKQVGNAVNVRMIEQCARYLIFGEPLF